MSDTQDAIQTLESFNKLPLGGVDRRALVGLLSERGESTATSDVAAWRAALTPAGTDLAKDACVLMLGGSNGILRAVAMQLVFAEGVPVHCVHYDSEKLQSGAHYARAIVAAGREAGVDVSYTNEDATKPAVVESVVAALKGRYRAVHFINGIAAGATKRYAQHGPTWVRDLDVAFDPVRQVPDFSAWENIRKIGLVKVEVATEQDIERTTKMMGASSVPWVEALASAGLLVAGESVVAFADYDFEADDPVYGMGPLAGAKVLQRESMRKLREQFSVRTVRLCYPAMNTTAIGAIPGGLLMFAGTAQVLIERGEYRNLATLARDTMPLFGSAATAGELRLDVAFAGARTEFRARIERMTNATLRRDLSRVVGNPAL